MKLPRQRFRDDGRSHFSYLDDVLVTCPKCAAAGHVLPSGVSQAHPKVPAFAPRRFYCSGCLHRAESPGSIVTFGTDGRDPYLRLPLRLQARTRHGVLYAYNGAHLDWIEAFVAAPLRERRVERGSATARSRRGFRFGSSPRRTARRCCARSPACAAALPRRSVRSGAALSLMCRAGWVCYG